MLVLGSSERTGAEEAGFLERWIATYIAELLDRDVKCSGTERAKIRKEIATVVPALWEQQLQRAALARRREIDWRERRVDPPDASTINVLCKTLANPSRAPALASHSKVDIMQCLIAVERLLTNYAVVNRAAREITSGRSAGATVDVLRAFLRGDEEAERSRKILFQLVPSLKSVDINDVETIERIVG